MGVSIVNSDGMIFHDYPVIKIDERMQLIHSAAERILGISRITL
jgi:hypothetical protein